MPITTLNEVMAVITKLPFEQVAAIVGKVHQTTMNITLNQEAPNA